MGRYSFTGLEPQKQCWWAAWKLCSPLGSADHFLFEKSISAINHVPVDAALGFYKSREDERFPYQFCKDLCNKKSLANCMHTCRITIKHV